MGRLLLTVLSAASVLCLGSAAHPAASGKEGKGEGRDGHFLLCTAAVNGKTHILTARLLYEWVCSIVVCSQVWMEKEQIYLYVNVLFP